MSTEMLLVSELGASQIFVRQEKVPPEVELEASGLASFLFPLLLTWVRHVVGIHTYECSHMSEHRHSHYGATLPLNPPHRAWVAEPVLASWDSC